MSLMMGNHPLVLELAKLLKLPAMTKSFRLSAGAGEVVSVECTYCPEQPDGMGQLQEICAKYQLQLVEHPSPSETPQAPVDVMAEVRRSAQDM